MYVLSKLFGTRIQKVTSTADPMVSKFSKIDLGGGREVVTNHLSFVFILPSVGIYSPWLHQRLIFCFKMDDITEIEWCLVYSNVHSSTTKSWKGRLFYLLCTHINCSWEIMCTVVTFVSFWFILHWLHMCVQLGRLI